MADLLYRNVNWSHHFTDKSDSHSLAIRPQSEIDPQSIAEVSWFVLAFLACKRGRVSDGIRSDSRHYRVRYSGCGGYAWFSDLERNGQRVDLHRPRARLLAVKGEAGSYFGQGVHRSATKRSSCWGFAFALHDRNGSTRERLV